MARRVHSDHGWTLTIPSTTEVILQSYPDLTEDILAEALSRIKDLDFREMQETVDLGRAVLLDDKVEAKTITADMPTSFSVRKGRTYPSRVVVNATREPSSLVTLTLGRCGHRTHLLHFANVGIFEPEPFSLKTIRNQKTTVEAALKFWCGHAFVFDPDHYESRARVMTWNEVMQPIRDREAAKDAVYAERRAARERAGEPEEA